MSKIIDVFKDYKEDNNLINAEIININLYKKSKKLEIELKADKPVELNDMITFEDYLKEKFQIQKVSFNIQNNNNVDDIDLSEQIKNDWKDISKYLSKNFAFCKAILNDSSIELAENKLIVKLDTKGSEFLNSYKIDKEIEDIIFNLYGKKLKVEYKEEITEEQIKKQEEYLESLEKNAYNDMMNEIKTQSELAKANQEKQENEEQENASEEKTTLIFGRNKNIKEQVLKISDLTTDYGKVAIEGKVISVDSRELKNGKTLGMFNIYDGTSTITCKSFIEKEKATKVLRKIK